ncbi:MAG: DegT/DnrJ/EryC1/StrS family aminotransferase, partial [Armatimonadetes bacterium]|nr:DegT/DnrJ/EryC1/StrS family aminotransferase [Armatimonadota bacterium]
MKAGREELMELVDLWGYSQETQKKIAEILEAEDVPPPHLFRYYGPSDGKGKVYQAEQLFAETMGAKYALAVNSGTSALMSAMAALGVGPGDEVIVPGYTFFASASIVVASRAIPVIAEINDSLNLDPEDVERKVTPQTKAIIAVHMKGMPADMDEIMAVARRHDLVVIEDTAQACGASYRGKMCGTIGDVGCYSFDFYKIAQSAEGGFVVTDDEFLHMRASSWHDTAACWRPNRYEKERREGELFCGENYRMSELQGAVALAQIRKLPDYVAALKRAKKAVRDRLELPPAVTLRRQPDPEGDASTALVMFAPDADTAVVLAKALGERGVSAGGRFSKDVRDWHVYNFWEHILEQKTVTSEGCPFTCPFYKGTLPDYSADMCPNTLDLLGRSLHIGVSETWDDTEAERIADAVNEAA